MGLIYELFKSFSEELDLVKLQKRFMGALLGFQNVERGSIWIRKGGGYLCIEAAGEESGKVKGMSLSPDKSSIVGWVIENGEMAVVRAGQDPRHYKGIEQELEVKSNLILAFPLLLKDKSVYGAIEIIDTCQFSGKTCLENGHLAEIQELINIGSVALGNALAYEKQLVATRNLQTALNTMRMGKDLFIGQSAVFEQVLRLMDSYAKTDYHVLISGESGTGKEIAANRIHQNSSRSQKPFIAQNCGAIPETLLESELFGYKKGAFTGADMDKPGLFEVADGGTIFLDEVGELPMTMQVKLLRVIQENEYRPLGGTGVQKVDVRIISATNRDLEKMVGKKEFRGDLFYRLAVLPLKLPSLRERRRDISLLLNHFLQKEALQNEVPLKRLAKETINILSKYSWPGNVRELQNLAKNLTVICAGDVVHPEDMPLHIQGVGILVDKFSEETDGASSSPAGENREVELDFYGLTWKDMERNYVRYLLKKIMKISPGPQKMLE